MSFMTGFKGSFLTRGGSRTVATFKMERFVIIVNGWMKRNRKLSVKLYF